MYRNYLINWRSTRGINIQGGEAQEDHLLTAERIEKSLKRKIPVVINDSLLLLFYEVKVHRWLFN